MGVNGDQPPRARRSVAAQPEPSPVIPRERGPHQPRPIRPAGPPPAPAPSAPPTALPRRRPDSSARRNATFAPPAPAKRSSKRRLQIIALSVLLAVLLAGAAGLGGALWLDTALHRTPVLADYPGRPVAAHGTNWLLVGSDSRQGLSAEQEQALATGGDIGNGRTDTIMLIHIPAIGSGGRATMVSIPRDSYVAIPGYGRDKINAAFALGGAPLLAQTVEQATGLRLDHFAEIGFGGFAAVVDALGGVTMCPTEPIDDPLAGIDLPSGCQKLDGRTALGYVRTRATPRADLDRMIDQRRFMSALLQRISSPAVWLDPWRWYSVPHAAADALTVDAGDHVWALARLGWALRGSPTALTVPIGDFTGNDAGSVVVWDHDAARRLFEALATDTLVPQTLLDAPP
jgi:LCP family protein required for cell wall assembly